MMIFDAVPRSIYGGGSLGPAAATVLWVVVATACWAALGGAAGFVLAWLGRGGLRLVAAAAAPVRGTCRALGLRRAADFFALGAA
jgi:hypothetical protein